MIPPLPRSPSEATGATANCGLCQRLLGEEWWQLHPAVRGMHSGGTSGVFEIRHGPGRLARLFLWIMRAPPAAETVPIRLDVIPCGKGEKWVRRFGTHVVASRQRELPGGLIAERFGPMEVHFRLHVAGGALHYQPVGACLCVGPFRLPLPGSMVSKGTAEEAPAGPERVRVRVAIAAPVAGFLISYEGEIGT